MCPAWGSQLHKAEPLLILRVLLQEPLDSAKTLQNSLGVIHPVHSHPKIIDLDPQLFEQGHAIPLGLMSGGDILECGWERDADGKRLDRTCMVLFNDRESLAVYSALHRSVHRVQEVVAVVLCVETNYIRTQHSIEKLLLPWAYPEGLGVGPGYVPEQGDAGVQPFFLYHPRQQREMVVLNQQAGRFDSFEFLQGGLGEFLVGFLILSPILGPELRAYVRDVAQGP